MKTKPEIEKEVRKMLDLTVRKKAYNTGILEILTNLYFEGYRDNQNEIKDVLGIDECDCPYHS